METIVIKSGVSILFLVSMQVNAALITSKDSFSSPTVVDFSQFDGPTMFADGPVEVGGLVGESITWQSSNSSSVIFGVDFTYGLPFNGKWNPERNGFIGLNSSFAFMDFLFATPVRGVGGFVNYPTVFGPPETPNIFALDSSYNPLEGYDLAALAPISTPNAVNDGR